MAGEGQSFNERQWEPVLYPECEKDLPEWSLIVHCQTHHGVVKGGLRQEGDKEGRGDVTITFNMEFPAKSGPNSCPVEGCNGQAATRTAIRVHFWNRHVRYTMV